MNQWIISRVLVVGYLIVIVRAASALWNVEIPRPSSKAASGTTVTDMCAKVSSMDAVASKLVNKSLLFSATQQGVRESVKFLQKHGFHDSKYENVTWPRLRRRPGAQVLETVAYASQFATEYIARRLKLSADSIWSVLPCVDVRETPLGQICPRDLTEVDVCPRKALQHRSPDGRCNNFEKPALGAAFSAFVRLLPARYADGISRVRTATAGSPLPSVRLISEALTPDLSNPHPKATLMLMQWGQFLDHDVSLATLSVSQSGFPPKCCRPLMSAEDVHPACLSIKVHWRDKFYYKFGITCMQFSRSAPAALPGCRLGPRDQINQVTAFMDASTLYGSTTEELNMVRLFEKGMLRHTEVEGSKPLLPPGTHAEILECQERGRNSKCFLAGDSRVNEQPGLTALHIIWLREHNRIALKLTSINPTWDDEHIFQEARRVVAAEMQHISFSEFLPAILGESVTQIFGLKLVPSGYFKGYDAEEHPGIANVFAAAALRFGHSLVPQSFHRYDRNHRLLLNDTPLHSEFFNPSELFKPGAVDRLVLGLLNQAAQSVDEYMTSEVTNRLFQPQGRDFGLDLMALNIQRARDHGIPEYLSWRRHCGLQQVRTFEELSQFMGPGALDTLKQVYLDVKDVDLFPAALAEKPVLGGMVGPTFACLIAEQFSRLRRADRFWYENGGLASSFNPQQLHELRRVSLARVLCDNLDAIETVQARVMEQTNQKSNRRLKCSRIPEVNLDYWKY